MPLSACNDYATWQNLEHLVTSGRCNVSGNGLVPRVNLRQGMDIVDSSQLVPIQLMQSANDVAPDDEDSPTASTPFSRSNSRILGKCGKPPPTRRSFDTHPGSHFSQLPLCSPVSKSGQLQPRSPSDFNGSPCHVIRSSQSGPIPLRRGDALQMPPDHYTQYSPSGPLEPAGNAQHGCFPPQAGWGTPRHPSRGAHSVPASPVLQQRSPVNPNGPHAALPLTQRCEGFVEKKSLCRASTWQGRKEVDLPRTPAADPNPVFNSRRLLPARSEGAKEYAEEEEDDNSFVFNIPQRVDAGSNAHWNATPDNAKPASTCPKFACDQSEMSRLFTKAQLERATNSWAEESILGKGGFGTVYKGILLDASCVAIKKIHVEGWQGLKEYNTELQVLSNIQHDNIVNLIGHCPDAQSLVYEYVPGGTLQQWLKDESKRSTLDWRDRLAVITGLAQALVALHESTPVVVHRDLKPENVLLDDSRKTKLADVGLARLLETEQGNCTYTVSGTAGFIDPEGMKTFEISPLADVYAFGLIVLQVLIGDARVATVHNLLGTLRVENMSQPRRVHAAVVELASHADSSAGGWPSKVSRTLAMVALKCIQRDRAARPGMCCEVLPVLQSLSA